MSLVTDDRPLSPGRSRGRAQRPGTVPESSSHRPKLPRWARSEGTFVFLIAALAYLTTLILLDFVFQIFPLDAVSRMANGFYVLYSNDPHLAAVGFVWNPLQSFAAIPFLLFKDLWPPLASHDVAGGLVSVLASAGAVYQLNACLRDWGVGRSPRVILTLGFGLNPMIIYYAGNGMSDALYVFTLVASTRYLLYWVRQNDLRSLVYSASMLGIGYLDRNEAVGSALLGGTLVLVTTFLRMAGSRRQRVMNALTDVAVFVLPVATTFVGWATASYVITGQAFPQFTSQYGNSSQTAASGSHYSLAVRVLHDVRNIEYLAPVLPIVLVISLILALRRRDARVLAPLAILGGSVAFDALGVIANSLQPWYRYFLASVPLSVLLIGCVVSGSAGVLEPIRAIGHRTRASGHRILLTLAASMFALIAVAPSLITSEQGIFAKNVQSSESEELGALLLAHPTLKDRQFRKHYAHIESIDAYIGRMHLPNGSIVADTFGECTPQIVTTVPNPKVFVITNDRDFKRVLADPLTFHAHFLLVPSPIGVGDLDALNVAYPSLYRTGAGFATFVHAFPTDGICADYRLYRVIGHPGQDQ
jgi:hypothetical protein